MKKLNVKIIAVSLTLLLTSASSLAQTRIRFIRGEFQTPVASQTSWAAFWQKFKAAVVNNDKPAVLSLSKESLSDADYRQLFGTRARRKCFATARAVRDEQGNYSVFCGAQGYSFQRVGEEFRFIEGFAND